MTDTKQKTRRPFWPKFTLADVIEANQQWRCNCGPATIASICGKTLGQVRPHLGDFERKGFMNPTMMYAALASMKMPHSLRTPTDWPLWGIARIQWHGPWMAEGVPERARYRYTHWVGACREKERIGIWDINGLSDCVGWFLLNVWVGEMVPHITSHIPRADGQWSITHSIEVEL